MIKFKIGDRVKITRDAQIAAATACGWAGQINENRKQGIIIREYQWYKNTFSYEIKFLDGCTVWMSPHLLGRVNNKIFGFKKILQLFKGIR